MNISFSKVEKECKTCAALREQLNYERQRNQDLLNTVTELLKPPPVIVQQSEAPLIQPQANAKLWSQRRQQLEANDRLKFNLVQHSNLSAKPDSAVKEVETEASEGKSIRIPISVEELERELGVVDSDHIDQKEEIS